MKKLLLLFSLTIASLGFAQGKIIKFTADIKNRKSDVLTIRTADAIVKEIKGDAKGHFEGSFQTKKGMYFLENGDDYVELYLKEGDDLKMKMDAKNINETLVFSGIGAEENNFLAHRNGEEPTDNYEAILALDEAAFNKALEAKWAKEISQLETLNPDFALQQKEIIEKEKNDIKRQYVEKQLMRKLDNSMSVSFDYRNFAGGRTKLEDFKGKYVYIDVWATWCGPCRAEIPHLKKIEEKYRNKNIVFVSISIDAAKDFEKWKTFVAEKKLGGVQLFSDKSWDDNFMTTYGVKGIPRFILIDPAGKILNSNAAQPSEDKLQEVLDKLLQ